MGARHCASCAAGRGRRQPAAGPCPAFGGVSGTCHSKRGLQTSSFGGTWGLLENADARDVVPGLPQWNLCLTRSPRRVH